MSQVSDTVRRHGWGPPTIDQIADPDSSPTPSEQSTARPAIIANRPHCPTCDGLHLLELDDGTVAPCPNCSDSGSPTSDLVKQR